MHDAQLARRWNVDPPWINQSPSLHAADLDSDTSRSIAAAMWTLGPERFNLSLTVRSWALNPLLWGFYVAFTVSMCETDRLRGSTVSLGCAYKTAHSLVQIFLPTGLQEDALLFKIWQELWCLCIYSALLVLSIPFVVLFNFCPLCFPVLFRSFVFFVFFIIGSILVLYSGLGLVVSYASSHQSASLVLVQLVCPLIGS